MKKMDEIIHRIVTAILKMVHKEDNEKAAQALTQFIKFGMVGVTNTLLSYAIYVAVLKLLEPAHVSWDYVAGNIVSFVLSVLWSFYWNNKYVFAEKEGQKRAVLPALLKTYAAYALTGILLTNVLSWVWIDVLGISRYIAPILNLVINTPLNFIINKIWAFQA